MSSDSHLPNTQRFAVVTGGGSGIGQELCLRLSELGWAVAVADIDLDAADRTLSLMATQGGSLSIEIDTAEPDAWAALSRRLRAGWPRLDLLVNNAGTLVGGEIAHARAEDLRRVVDVNLTGVLLGCRELTPWLIETATRRPPASRHSRQPGAPRSGVINTASIFAPLAPPGFAAYSATKAAAVAASEALRGELAPHGLNVTVTLPGTVGTGLFARARFTEPAFAAAASRFVKQADLPPRAVADQTLQAAAAGRFYAVIGRRARWYDRLKQLAPGLTRWTIARRARRELGLPQQIDGKTDSTPANHSLMPTAPPVSEGPRID